MDPATRPPSHWKQLPEIGWSAQLAQKLLLLNGPAAWRLANWPWWPQSIAVCQCGLKPEKKPFQSKPLRLGSSISFKLATYHWIGLGWLGGGRFLRKIVAFRSMLPKMVNAQHCWRFKWQTLLLFICSQRKVKHPFDFLPIMDPQNRIDPFQ